MASAAGHRRLAGPALAGDDVQPHALPVGVPRPHSHGGYLCPGHHILRGAAPRSAGRRQPAARSWRALLSLGWVSADGGPLQPREGGVSDGRSPGCHPRAASSWAGWSSVGRSLRVVQQYEQGIVFRFGRVLPGTRGPGLTILRPVGDRMQKVNMQIIAMAVPAQEGITRDNVSVRVDAVVYFRVVDPIKAVVNVQNYMFAVSQQAQTSLRSIIGQSEMDQLLAERDTRQPGAAPDHRRADRGAVGHPGRAGRDQGREPARGHEAVHVPAGRGRAGTAGQDHLRRR